MHSFLFSNFFKNKPKSNFNFLLFASASLFLGSQFTYKKYAYMKSAANVNNLPIYTRREVMEHCTMDKRIWITFQDGVYDVTDFIAVHPGGGEKIMMIAGGVLDPFWEMYSFHKKDENYELLNKYKIGILDPKDRIDKATLPNYDNLKRETIWRSPFLKTLLDFPYCAEGPQDRLVDNFYTPNEYFFIRNHNLVPEIKVGNYKLVISDGLTGKKLKFSIADLKKKYKTHKEDSIIMCTGNRRSQMHKPQVPRGLSWNVSSIANGSWEGIALRDILIEMGYHKDNSKGLHLIANGWDKDMQGVYFSISIPLDVVFADDNEVLLAYGYNGGDIPYEHGFPIRLVIPGFVGARNVKWLKSLEISTEESQGASQQRDYKIIPKGIDWDKADLSKLPALMEHVLNSAIVTPAHGQTLNKGSNILIKGWAIGHYGSIIKKVQLSFDQGKSWQNIEKDSLKYNTNTKKNKAYGWTLWEYSIDPNWLQSNEIWVKAEDEEGNVQPESCEEIWNIRGLMNNSIHKINVNLV